MAAASSPMEPAPGGKDTNNLEEQANVFAQDGSVDIKGRPVRKSKTGNWKACPFILGNEMCERLAFYGINTNLVTFLTQKLNQSNSTASVNVSNWSGTCYITPLLGAFLADAYLGRYWTIATFSAIYFVGMALLTMTTAVPSLVPPKNGSATLGQLAALYVALYLIALGTGGIKPCVSSFGADQFDENDHREKKNKVSFFNWFYFSINIGALISATVLVYIQDNVSWTWGFGVPAAMMGVAIISFFSGTPLFRHQKPGGSPVTRTFQVLTAAFRNFKVAPVADPNMLHETTNCSIQGSRKLEHTNFLSVLDKAAIKVEGDKRDSSPWKLCTVTQVEEVKALVKLLPIWATGIVFATVYAQMSTMFVEQGQGMNRQIGSLTIGSASMSLFDTLSVIVWVPIYDRLIVPGVRRLTKDVRGFTQLQRMGIGLGISITSMIAAAIVEIKRLAIARDMPQLLNAELSTPVVPISAFAQVPQYFLVGAAEVFTFAGQIEFFYDQAPDAMRSLCSALSLTTVALGNYLSSLLVTIVTKITTHGGKPGWIPEKNLNVGHLDYFFWLLAIMSFLNLLCYLGCAHWYTYKKPYAEDEADMAQVSRTTSVPLEGSQKQG